MGRPTIMTPKIIDKLREAFMMGCSDREACLYAKIANQTLYNYQQEHPEFLEQKTTYKINPLLKARKTIFDNLDEIKTAQWYMERKAKQEFSLEAQMGSDLDLINEETSTEIKLISFKDNNEEMIKRLTKLLSLYKKEGIYSENIKIGQRIDMGRRVIDSDANN